MDVRGCLEAELDRAHYEVHQTLVWVAANSSGDSGFEEREMVDFCQPFSLSQDIVEGHFLETGDLAKKESDFYGELRLYRRREAAFPCDTSLSIAELRG